MALRSIWQSLKDLVYDAVSDVFRTQEEIDEEVEGNLSTWGTVVYDQGDVEPSARLRPTTFISHIDAISWIQRAGIPPHYVWIYAEEDGDDDNYLYRIYVKDGS